MRLNVFQRVMRLWDEVHPYNAAQVLHLEGTADPDRLNRAWQEALAALGLGRIHINGDRFRHEPARNGTAAPALRVVENDVGFADFISDEMNRRFDPPGPSGFCTPFRPFIYVSNGSYHAGVIYHHWVADSASIRMLLREWFLRIYDPARVRTTPLRTPAGGYWHFFGPSRSGWELDDGILSTLRSTTRLCNARRIPTDGGGYHVRYSSRPVPDGLIDELRDAARRQQVTLNDVFLTAMAMACDHHGATPPAPSLQELALGTIVDLRPGSRVDLSDTFGQFLGFTTVVVGPPLLGSGPALLRSIARQNALQKRSRGAHSSVLRMAGGLARATLLAPAQREAFYRKWMPMAAGISNVNMNTSWALAYHPSPLLDYLRVTPTGPMLPVVFTTTTLGKRFHVALTRRSELVDDRTADRLLSTFLEQLASIIPASR